MNIVRQMMAGLLLVGISGGTAIGEGHPTRMVKGETAAITGAVVACGEWGAGKRIGCLTLFHGKEPKIGIYALEASDNVMRLAAAVDRELQRDESLKGSFVIILDEKRHRETTSNSNVSQNSNTHTFAETQKRFAELNALGTKYQVKSVTLGLSNRPRAMTRERLELTEANDVLVTFLGNGYGSRTSPGRGPYSFSNGCIRNH